MTQQFNNVFISYASEDFRTASKLYNHLIKNDYNPWLDKYKLLPGQTWDIEIQQALRRADFIILLLSNNSVEKRGYVQREFKLALEYIEEKLDTDIYIIPCKIDNCETPHKLNKYQWISLIENDSFDKILASLNIQRDRYKEAERKKILSNVSFDYENIEKEYTVDSKPQSNVKIKYPKFKNIENESLNELNAIIEGTITRQYIRGREIILEAKDDENLLKRHIEYGFPGYSITINLEFTLITKDFVSIISNSYSNTGGVHGNYASVGYNYSLNPLGELTNSSFIHYGYTLNFISNICRKYIIEKVKEHTGEEDNESDYFLNEKPLEPDIENFKNFFLDKNGVNFIFNPYEVTAYALGQHVIPVSYSDLLAHSPNSETLKKLIRTQVFM